MAAAAGRVSAAAARRRRAPRWSERRVPLGPRRRRRQRGVEAVSALATAAFPYSNADRSEKLRRLAEAETRPIRHPGALLRLPEALCFLRPYDSPRRD